MKRRSFLTHTSTAIGAGLIQPNIYTGKSVKPDLGSWSDVRSLFKLDPDYIHMAQMLLASHPAPVQEALDKYREMMNLNPADVWEKEGFSNFDRVREAAASYLGAEPGEIALTDSTTQGLGVLYNGLALTEGDDVLTTEHDHYSTHTSLKYASQKNGASVRKIALYEDASQVTTQDIVQRIESNIRPNTRVVAVTWVHSSTGVKLPIASISECVSRINEDRVPHKRIYLSVDGVHGFGIEDIDIRKMGCDFFVAGTHKWIFGPRGTGLIWAKREAWDFVKPTIPAFRLAPYEEWMGFKPKEKITFSDLCSPGGFHAFEHRWALKEAFNMHLSIGKDRIAARTHELGLRLREGLEGMGHIRLHTPLSSDFSSGINCFEVEGITPQKVVENFHEKHIIASSSPYRTSYARLTPAITNTEAEVDRCLEVLNEMTS